jgi:hypothetical protein
MKKLSKILAKLRTASVGSIYGACCCRDRTTGKVNYCGYISQDFCMNPYEIPGEVCIFYPTFFCEDVSCRDPDTVGANPKPSIESEEINFDPNGNTIDPSSVDGGGDGGGPVPCPTSPTNIPTDCELEASDVAACLETLMVGSNADHPTAKLLRGLVVGWGRYRCPEVRSLCHHAAQGHVGCYPGMTITDMKCYCRIHEEYWKGLKRIVEEFCAGNSSGEKVRRELTKLCKQLKLARNRCAGGDGLPRDPIKDSDNSLSLNCGIKRVD